MVMSSVFMQDHNYYFIIILLFSYIHIHKQHYMTSTTYYTIRHNLIAVRIPGQDGSGNRTIFNRQLTASVPLVYVCMNWPHINVHSQLHA